MGLNVSYRHFGNQDATAKMEREKEREREDGTCVKPAAMVT